MIGIYLSYLKRQFLEVMHEAYNQWFNSILRRLPHCFFLFLAVQLMIIYPFAHSRQCIFCWHGVKANLVLHLCHFLDLLFSILLHFRILNKHNSSKQRHFRYLMPRSGLILNNNSSNNRRRFCLVFNSLLLKWLLLLLCLSPWPSVIFKCCIFVFLEFNLLYLCLLEWKN